MQLMDELYGLHQRNEHHRQKKSIPIQIQCSMSFVTKY